MDWRIGGINGTGVEINATPCGAVDRLKLLVGVLTRSGIIVILMVLS